MIVCAAAEFIVTDDMDNFRTLPENVLYLFIFIHHCDAFARFIMELVA